MRKCKITIFPSNKLEILLRFSASASYYALSCVKGFCICWREKSPLLEQLLSVSICIKHQVKYKVKMKLNMFTSNSIRKAISSTEYSCLIYHKKKPVPGISKTALLLIKSGEFSSNHCVWHHGNHLLLHPLESVTFYN